MGALAATGLCMAALAETTGLCMLKNSEQKLIKCKSPNQNIRAIGKS
jgi:hypothetical protein